MNGKIFMLAEDKSGESTLAQGYVYALPQNEKERLVSAGKAVAVDFPRIDALELSVKRAVSEFKTAEQRIKESPRYRTNEGEREWQLEQLATKLDEDVKKLVADYQLEIEATQKDLAQKAVQATFKPNEQITNFVNTEMLHLEFSSNVVEDLELFAVKVSALSDEEKATILHNYGKIKQTVEKVAGNKGEGILKDIYNAVKGSNGATAINLQLKQLKALKTHYNVATPYTTMKILRSKKGGRS